MISLDLRILPAIIIPITALLLAVACGGAATATPSPAARQSTPDSGPTSLSRSTPSESAISSPATQPAPSRRPPNVVPLPGVTPQPIEPPVLTLRKLFEASLFSRLTNLVPAGGHLFVTEQTGRVMLLPAGPEPSEADVFLDIRDRVSDVGNEEGLLGLAFDPEFDSNGHFYVYYSAANPRRSVVSRFTAAAGPAGRPIAAPESELVVMEVVQPYRNHNGGQLAFGPDAMLYIALGDGGLGGDPQGNGQDPSTLLGSILRIDISGLGPDQGYRVPPDNPFAGSPNARGEVWAYGFRNPWRFSFDRQNGDLWTGDVGQASYEEVDLVQRGGNYGWNTLEGNHCFSPRTGCDPSGTILPVIEYGADKGCSVIGGYVYRGAMIPYLTGAYLYGDYCSGEVYGFRFENGEVAGHSMLLDSGLRITSFGQDENGEIYILSQDGGIYRLKADS